MTNSRAARIFAALLLVGCGGSANDAKQSTPVSIAGAGSSGTAPSAGVAASGAGTGGVAPVAGTTATAPAPSGSAPSAGVPAAAGTSASAGGAGQGGATTPAAGMKPADELSGTVTLTMESFLLKAGEETYKCQNFDNPFANKDTALQFISTDMSPGSHHLHVYHMKVSDSRDLENCTINDFHPLLFSAGSPHAETTYPAGFAAKLLGTAGVRIQVHYINTSDKDLTVNAVLKLSPGDYSSITKWVSELYFNNLGLRVPPGAGHTATTTCAIPQTYGPIGLIQGGTHMHKHGVHFTAKTSTGVTLADVNTWDEPPRITYDPPIMLMPGDTITWSCTYNNDSGRTLMFGESAETNEMCIYLARFFSAPDGAQLECQSYGATGTATTRTY